MLKFLIDIDTSRVTGYGPVVALNHRIFQEILMKKITLACLSACVLAAGLGSAQTVTVDNTLATPDNVTTFSSLMAAIHSFQASGSVTTATTAGGVGVNHGNAAPNIINVVSTGTAYNELVRIDERTTQGAQSIHDEAFTISGQDDPTNGLPVILCKDALADTDGFEIRTDVDFTIENLIISRDPAFPDTGNASRLMTMDRITASTGTPSEFTLRNVIFTALDNTGAPLVTNKDEAFIDRRADIQLPTGGTWGRTVAFFPDANEGMIGNFVDCVFSNLPDFSTARPAALYLFFGGTTGAPWTQTAGANIEGSIFTYVPGVSIEVQAAGHATDANNQFLNITGSNAKSGGLDTGSPTVMAGNGIAAAPGNGVGVYVVPTDNGGGAMAGAWDNLWIYNNTGAAIDDDVLDRGGTLHWSLADSLIVNNNLASGGFSIITSRETTTAITPANWTISNTTIAGNNAIASTGNPTADTRALIQIKSTANSSTPLALDNVIMTRGTSGGEGLVAIRNSGTPSVTVSDSLIALNGPYALQGQSDGTGTVTINPSVLDIDPAFAEVADPTDIYFYAPSNQALVGARTGSADLDGGRIMAPPQLDARTWNRYN